MNRALRVFPVLLLAALPTAAMAQNVITCGQTRTGTMVNANTTIVYSFGANAGEAVVVAGVATQGGIDGVDLELRAPNGSLIGTSQGERFIPSTRLPATGVYTIVVRPVAFFQPSTFNVNLQFTTGRCAGPVACGQTLNVAFDTPAEQDAYSFDGNAGEAVVIAAEAHVLNQVDAGVDVYRPDGVLLGRNEFDPNTPSLVLPMTGRYTVVAHDAFFYFSTGQYIVDLQFTTGRCGAPLACGQTPAGSFELQAAQDSYVFNAAAGESVLLAPAGTSPGVDARVELYDPAGTLVAETVVGTTPAFTILTPGVYTAVVHDQDYATVGGYRLNLQFATGRCAVPLGCAQTLAGTISVPAEQDALSFPSATGDWFLLHAAATSPPLEAYGELYDSAGLLLGAIDPLTPTILFDAAQGGLHTVLVSDTSRVRTGPYQVHLDCLKVSASASTVTEGNAGTTDAVFTVTLAAASTQPVTVSYFALDGTAVAGADFVPTGGTLTFAPGVTARTVSVPVLGDVLDEPDERFYLHLTWPDGPFGSAGVATGTIVDDDGQVIRLLELNHGTRIAGTLAAQPGPVADQDLFLVEQRPRSSYEVVIDGTSGDVGGADGLALERIAPDVTTAIQSSVPVGTGPSRSLRWQNLSTLSVLGEMVRVRSAACGTDCGPDDVYRLRFYDTTGSIARFNNTGSQVTILLLQNPGNATVNGTAYFWATNGAVLVGHPFTIEPKALLALNTSTVNELIGRGGSITIAHDGGYGGLTGKTVALEPTTGFAFDSLLGSRPVP